MANKQTQNIQDYIFDIPMRGIGDIMPNMVSIVSDLYTANGERTIGRLSPDDLFTIGKEYSGVLTIDNVGAVLDDKYLAISKETEYTISTSLDIISSNDLTRGVQFPNGVSFIDNQGELSFIGWGYTNPSDYGDSSTNSLDCNICNGTFRMQKVYVDDLWVKNLHTAESNSSDGDKTIQNLTVGKFIPSEITGFIDVDGNFCFNSNNESGTLSFENGGFKLSKDLTISGDSGSLSAGLVSTNELSPRNMNSDGEFLTYMYGGFSFVKNFPNQRYLVAGTDDNAVFNSNGGLTKVYSQSEIDTKIKSLEARIAALEAK